MDVRSLQALPLTHHTHTPSLPSMYMKPNLHVSLHACTFSWLTCNKVSVHSSQDTLIVFILARTMAVYTLDCPCGFCDIAVRPQGHHRYWNYRIGNAREKFVRCSTRSRNKNLWLKLIYLKIPTPGNFRTT